MMPHGLTAGQAERLRLWLRAARDVAAAEAEELPEDDRWRAYYRGQASALDAAERALRVASVGALPLSSDGG
jgi:hypothetical protein